jgi:hypothetical protein
VSGSELKAVVPAHSAGVVNVRIVTPGGVSPATSADQYTYGAPTVIKVSPDAGSTAGGGTVTISGTGFVAGATVAFGAGTSSTSVTFVSGSELKAVVPAHSAGVVNVRIVTPAGVSPATSADQYTYTAP